MNCSPLSAAQLPVKPENCSTEPGMKGCAAVVVRVTWPLPNVPVAHEAALIE